MYSSYSVAAVVCSIVFPVLASLAVFFRLRARRVQKLKWALDDYLVIVTLVLAIALCMVFLNGALNASIGQDPTTITPEQFSLYQQHIYYAIILAYLSYGLVKLCVLTFYKRIFSVLDFIHFTDCMTWIVILWTIATFFAAVFSAWPISDFWTLGGTYTINHPDFLFMSTVLNATFDLFILGLPFHMIKKLNTSRQTKIQLVGLFSLGFFCVFAAGLRIHYGHLLSHAGDTNAAQLSNDEFSYISASNAIWCEIESCCSIIAACLPCIRPIFRSPPSLRALFRKVRSLLRSIGQVSMGRFRGKSSGQNTGDVEEYPLPDTASSRDLILEAKVNHTEILVAKEVVVGFGGNRDKGSLDTVDEGDMV